MVNKAAAILAAEGGRSGVMANKEVSKQAGYRVDAESRMSRARYAELKHMLDERRREIQAEVQGKMRGVREEGTWGGKLNEVLDAVESSEADIQEELEFALIQMKSETLNKVNDALRRLEEGDYGYCFECGEEIAEKRLRALPFAVRCKDCEEQKEVAEQRERQAARRGSASLFLDM
jgi:DnaK suppressor protein